jgi:thiamine pyrophosphate-dependent acetolactate synthase large subunit-like protein
MATMTGSQALVEELKQENVEYVFGLPGTTSLNFLNTLEDHPEIRYILGLHETVALGMAEGYARFSGKPGVVNLHSCPGLSAAMPMLFNAFQGEVPIVVTAVQQDARIFNQKQHLNFALTNVAGNFTKFSTAITNPDDFVLILKKAFKIALEPPCGPVFVSLPQETMSNTYNFKELSLSANRETARPERILPEKANLENGPVPLLISKSFHKLKHQLRPNTLSRLLNELKKQLKPDTIVVEESPSYAADIQHLLDFKAHSNYFHSRAGRSIGCALPNALGAKLAAPDRPVVAIVGDGSAIWSIQSLWTAAHYHIPVIFIVMANGSYNILKIEKRLKMGKTDGERYLGLDFNEPRLDFPKIAQAMGITGRRIEEAEETGQALKIALESKSPYLIEFNLRD